MIRREATTVGTEVEEAIADLAGLRSSDPAARHAVHAIRLTQMTLEEFWLDSPQSDDASPSK